MAEYHALKAELAPEPDRQKRVMRAQPQGQERRALDQRAKQAVVLKIVRIVLKAAITTLD